MKEQREFLKKKTEENQKKQELSKMAPKEAFKMRQFSNVQSKVRQDINDQNVHEEIRPQTAQVRRTFLRAGSARGPRPPTANSNSK